MEVAIVDSNRWIIVGLLILFLAAAPFFLIAFGLGWAWRGVVAVPHKLTFSLRPPIAQ